MTTKLERVLSGLGLSDLLPSFLAHKIDDRLLSELNERDLRELGVETIGDRKRLLQEFEHGSGAGFAAKAKPAPPLIHSAVPARSQESAFADNPLAASKTKPFVNSLGLPFVPIPRSKTLFCIWQLRIRDYERYCAESGEAVPVADFPQDPDHPVVNVNWNDAHLFCEWLTRREEGVIPKTMIYRLPKDEEWSMAVLLTNESGSSPRARSGIVDGYPWGTEFPPPPGVGNYHPRYACDPFPETSPVGSFPPNKLGIYDLGGNVWEWCMDEYEEDHRAARGASCFNDDPEFIRSSFRNHFAPDHGQNNLGIRIVLAPSVESTPWH